MKIKNYCTSKPDVIGFLLLDVGHTDYDNLKHRFPIFL